MHSSHWDKTEAVLVMKVLILVSVFFIGHFLFSEGGNVLSRLSKRGNVYNTYYGTAGSKEVMKFLKKLYKKLDQIIKNNRPSSTCKKIPKNCAEVLKCGGKKSGVYTVKPDYSKGAFKVYCDQKTDGGGWTVFQKRLDGSVNFYRGWNYYKAGFGHLTGEFWLGLDKIYRLTHQTRNRLRVELEDTTGKSVYAEYDYFAVASEGSKYSLSLGTYSGTAGDSLSYHRGSPFSTKDRDNDQYKASCAIARKGAWWYKACYHSNLNGLYLHGAHKTDGDGINWYHWKGYKYSAKRSEMKIRPV